MEDVRITTIQEQIAKKQKKQPTKKKEVKEEDTYWHRWWSWRADEARQRIETGGALRVTNTF